MRYEKSFTMKDGRTCILRNGTEQDGQKLLDVFIQTHAETDYLLSYPDETEMTAETEAAFLKESTEGANRIEMIAEVDGVAVGAAGFAPVGKKEKVRHRAEFGISVFRDYWGLGIGRAMTEACIECAEAAGITQLELEVVAENKAAIALYESEGFIEYGRNPKGFRSRLTGWQELVLMRLDLEDRRRS
ncbi:MAG: GNAT family N-acetyltransferase [Lachnospiraceae bacterium]|nr:GNAT family N-acetyltransferase [Lachnospiraceae bacterium]